MHICSVALFYYSRIMLCKWTCITKSGNDFFRKYLALKCFPKQFVLLSIKKLLTSCHIMMIPLLCLLENFIFSLSHIQSSNLYFPLVCLHSWYLGFTCALSLANVSCSCVPKKNFISLFFWSVIPLLSLASRWQCGAHHWIYHPVWQKWLILGPFFIPWNPNFFPLRYTQSK